MKTIFEKSLVFEKIELFNFCDNTNAASDLAVRIDV